MRPGPEAEVALLALAARLRAHGYAFTTVTPATHARVNARPGNVEARTLRDVIGWSRPFRADAADPGIIDPEILADLRAAGVVEPAEGGPLARATIRVSSLGRNLFVHAAYPPLAPDAVFFGPDTLRFVGAVSAHLDRSEAPVRRAVDLGTGTGAAALAVAQRFPEATVTGVDINPAALRIAALNARINAVPNVSFRRSDLLDGVEGAFDLVVSNPPFMVDAGARAYRHGGGPLGADLSLRVIAAAGRRLAPGGSLVLFTGAAIVEGDDPFRDAAGAICAAHGLDWSYREADPDAYGEELDEPGYAAAERIALVVLTARRPA